MDNLKSLGYDILKTSAGVFVVRAANLPEMAESYLPGPTQRLADGVLYSTSREVVNIVSEGESKLTNGDWIGLLDNIAFFTALSVGVNESGVGGAIVNAVNSVSPLQSNQNLIIAEGAIVSLGTVTAQYLDTVTGNNPIFDFIRRPVSTVMARLA